MELPTDWQFWEEHDIAFLERLEIEMDIANSLEHGLLELFIMKDFMACNKYLPIDPRRQAMKDYQTDPAIQGRVNGIVGDILEIVEACNESLHTEEH